ncbi:hypothetical protein [Cryptosporangium aurantiacum]|uniref:Uncharacterized protein n=1 Tax=Cryptosporangium aurantiacum TaxID=134849 RepID=A0A1M7TUR9_9ACTN|nr:hypothetical protein [Cryptosporangium aurantiacum]SHN74475.1 hypothetical protein SAMN05443668_10788 [Cryptosporangium aurantiacum]
MTSTPSTTDRARETAGTAQQEGTALASSAKDAGSDVARTASDQASQVAGEAKAQAADLLRTTKDEVSGQVDAQRQRLVSALRTTGDELGSGRDQHSALTAELTQRAGDYTRRFADYLDAKGPDAILEDVRSFARRRPGTFLLLAGAAGVVAGRVFRSVSAASGEGASDSGEYRASIADTGTSTTYSGLGVGTTETIPAAPARDLDDTAIGVAEVPPAQPVPPVVPQAPGTRATTDYASGYTPGSDPYPPGRHAPGGPTPGRPAPGAPGDAGYVSGDTAYRESSAEPGYGEPGYGETGYPPPPPAAPVTDPRFSDPVQPGSAHTGPVQPDPLASDPVHPEPVRDPDGQGGAYPDPSHRGDRP